MRGIVTFVIALALALLVVLAESWAAWTIWQWKLVYVFPMAAPYMSLATIFYLNLALSVCLRHFNPVVKEKDQREMTKNFLYFALSPFILVAAVWLLIRLGY